MLWDAAFWVLRTFVGSCVCGPSQFLPFSRTHHRRGAREERRRLVFLFLRPILGQRISLCVIDKWLLRPLFGLILLCDNKMLKYDGFNLFYLLRILFFKVYFVALLHLHKSGEVLGVLFFITTTKVCARDKKGLCS